MGKITYPRGTTLNITHNYTAPTYMGAKLVFGVKTIANDTDPTDLTNSIMTPKVITMSGTTFPQSTPITINPTDVAVTRVPSTYFYAIKIFDSNGAEYIVDSGQFVLTATAINEVT